MYIFKEYKNDKNNKVILSHYELAGCGTKISETPTIPEVNSVLSYLERIEEDHKEYRFFDFLMSTKSLSILSMLTISILLFYLFSTNYEIENVIKLSNQIGDNYFNAMIGRVNYVYLCLFIVTTIFYIMVMNLKIAEKKERNKEYYKFLNHFKKLKKDIEINEERKKSMPAFKNEIFFKNIKDNSNQKLKDDTFNIMFLILTVFWIPLFLVTTVKDFTLKEVNVEGAFSSVHYIDNKYVIFENKNGFMKKLIIPENISVRISTTAKKEERYYKAFWLEHSGHILPEEARILSPSYYVEIKMTKEEYIKGTLINK